MQKYYKLLQKSLNKKYKAVTIFEKNFFKLFLRQRKKAMEYINTKKNDRDIVKKKDATYELIENLYDSKKNLKNEKKIYIFYKKFENNLSLKRAYNKRFQKISNNETSLPTYVTLGLLINQSSQLNNLQKLNCILKILDKILKNKKNINIFQKKKLLSLINIEKNNLKLL